MRRTSRSYGKAKGWWATFSEEYDEPGVALRVELRIAVALLVSVGVGVVVVVVAASTKSWIRALVAAIIHVSFAFSLPRLVYRRWTLRLIPTGCILWMVLPSDFGLAIDSYGMDSLAGAVHQQVETVEQWRQRLAVWSLGGYGAVAVALVRVYRAHVETMHMRENPQPVWALFLFAGGASWSAMATWCTHWTLHHVRFGGAVLLGLLVGVVAAMLFQRRSLARSEATTQAFGAALSDDDWIKQVRSAWIRYDASRQLASVGVRHPDGVLRLLNHLQVLGRSSNFNGERYAVSDLRDYLRDQISEAEGPVG